VIKAVESFQSSISWLVLFILIFCVVMCRSLWLSLMMRRDLIRLISCAPRLWLVLLFICGVVLKMFDITQITLSTAPLKPVAPDTVTVMQRRMVSSLSKCP